LEKEEGGYHEEVIETFRGPVTVAWKGSKANPAILTYHDLGLNHVSNFQVRLG
jgi:protein NDRG1